MLLTAGLLLLLSVNPAEAWYCVSVQSKTLHEGVEWRTQNCTKGDPSVDPPLLVVNSIHVDMTRPDLRVIPAIADPVAQVQNLPDMASQNDNFIAGVNGGYFWRVDIDGFWRDNVCRGKLRKEAEQPASPLFPNFGIGDGLVKIDGEVFSNNCNCTGYSRPAVLKLDGRQSSIDVLQRGETVPPTVHNAIGAGPNLVSYDAQTGQSYVDVPADDDNINKLVYEATTAVGLVYTPIEDTSGTNWTDVTSDELVMVTTDGSDSCMPWESYCGLFSPDLASLMREVFGCGVAMSMDQGGSTTMWVRGENDERSGIVSNSDNKEEASGTGRALANGLFVELLRR